MSANTFGTLLKVCTFGESHGKGVGAMLEGCPPGMPLSEEDIQPQLTRRKPGQSVINSPRLEGDKVSILSGVEKNLTLGTPIGLLVHNQDQKPSDYQEMRNIPRPSHADYTYQMKYGIRASSGGGRSSARETIGRVAAGGIAEKILHEYFGVDIVAWVNAAGEIEAPDLTGDPFGRDQVDINMVRCPHPETAEKMIAAIQSTRERGDSMGGIVTCVCRHVPPGWGEPVFDKLEARLAQAMMSIPATKGFEIGSGFGGTLVPGSLHNDPFVDKGEGKLGTLTNHSGGIQGGISNGEQIIMRIAFKPPATISLPQKTVDFEGNELILEALGRHDPFVANRAVPIVESMAALVLADMAMMQKGRKL